MLNLAGTVSHSFDSHKPNLLLCHLQVFVDEQTCIGCRNCVAVSPQTFAMEDEFGRARAEKQGVDTQGKLQEAIDTCPVDCISFVGSCIPCSDLIAPQYGLP